MTAWAPVHAVSVDYCRCGCVESILACCYRLVAFVFEIFALVRRVPVFAVSVLRVRAQELVRGDALPIPSSDRGGGA